MAEKEIFWIKKLNTLASNRCGYNIEKGGKGSSRESRQKVSTSNMGHIVTEETRNKISETHKRNGHKPSKEAIENSKRIKTYTLLSPTGKIIITTTDKLIKFCKENNLKRSSLFLLSSKHKRHQNGYLGWTNPFKQNINLKIKDEIKIELTKVV